MDQDIAGVAQSTAARDAAGHEPGVSRRAALRWTASTKLAAEAVGRGLQFVLALYAQRTLGQALYGEFTYVVAAAFVCSALTDLGLALIVTREMARDRAGAARVAGAGLALKLLLSLAAGLAIVLIGLSRPPEFRGAAVMLGLAMLPASFVDYFGYVFRGLQRVELDAALGLGLRILTAALGALALASGLGLGGLAGAYLAGSGLMALIAYAWLRGRYLVPRVTFDRAAWSALLREALPLGGAVALSILYTRTGIFMLERFQGVESVGVYGVALKLTEPLAIVPAALLAAVFPALSHAMARRDGMAGRLRRRTVLLLGLAGSGVALAGVLGGPRLIGWLYGGQFAGAEAILQVLALATLPSFVNYALTHFLIAQGRQRLNLAFNAVIVVLNAVLCLLLIPRFGTAGAAAAVLTSEAVLFALCWIALRPAAPARAALPQHAQHAVTWRERIALAALAALAFVLPFELKTPLLIVGPVAVTNVELALYAALALWVLARPRLRVTPVHVAVLGWVIVLWLSAAVAPAERAAALKFALRATGGGMLALAAAGLVTTSGRAILVAGALAAGALLSAAAGLGEMWIPGLGGLLLAFKTQPSQIGGFLRATGTFQYANTAAMYWEAALPLVVVLAALAWMQRARRRVAAGVGAALGVLLLAQALAFSASRAGLAGAALALALLFVLGARLRLPVARIAGAGLALLVVVAAINLTGNSLTTLRLSSENDAAWYQAEYAAAPLPALEAGRTVQATVTVRNTGLWTWQASGSQPVNLSYHWRPARGSEPVVFDGLRAPLPREVPPGDRIELVIHLRAPAQPGRYVLQWDMVHEGVTWFSGKGARTGDVAVTVLPAQGTGAGQGAAASPGALPPILPQPSRLQLWSAGLRMWQEYPWLGVGPDNFRHLYGPYIGPGQFDDRIHANSFYVETLSTLGVLGVAALIALPLALAWMALRTWPQRDVATRLLLAGVIVALAAFYVHGLVDYFLEFTPTYALFWMLVGMAAGLLASPRPGMGEGRDAATD